jgi:Ca2+:H+ antiporter
MLLFSTLALTTPSTLRMSAEKTTLPSRIRVQSASALSKGISILILLLYLSWLVFSWRMGNNQSLKPPIESPNRRGPGSGTPYRKRITNARFDAEEALGAYTFSIQGCFVALILTTISIGFNTQFTTDSLQSLLLHRKVSQTFLSLIILPLLSIDPMAISMANKDNMDMSILLTLERCMQTSLFLAPLTVLIAWRMGSTSMDLEFDKFSLAVLFLSVILVTHVLQGGESNW